MTWFLQDVLKGEINETNIELVDNVNFGIHLAFEQLGFLKVEKEDKLLKIIEVNNILSTITSTTIQSIIASGEGNRYDIIMRFLDTFHSN
jgi:hypothetical protein